MKKTLTRTENKNKTFTYQITDESGKVIAQRISKNGNYIACSTEGNYYFSRLDLIGKGDSGKFFKRNPEALNNIAYLTKTEPSVAKITEWEKSFTENIINKLKQIDGQSLI